MDFRGDILTRELIKDLKADDSLCLICTFSPAQFALQHEAVALSLLAKRHVFFPES